MHDPGFTGSTIDRFVEHTPSAAPRTIRHPVVIVDELLTEAEWSALLARVLASEAQFQPSGTHDARTDYRHSLVMNPPSELVQPVVGRVRSITPDVLPELRVQPIVVGIVEAQVTASVDGSFFGVHTDADRVKVPKRYLTYVYYFNRQPKGFSGGELRIYDDVLAGSLLGADDARGDAGSCGVAGVRGRPLHRQRVGQLHVVVQRARQAPHRHGAAPAIGPDRGTADRRSAGCGRRRPRNSARGRAARRQGARRAIGVHSARVHRQGPAHGRKRRAQAAPPM